MLNLVSLSTQSLASCVNYFCLELFNVFFQHENRFRYKFFDIVQFSRSCAPQPLGWRPDYFTTEVVFCQALFGNLLNFLNLDRFMFLGANRNIPASIGSFQRLPAEVSEVILLSQRLALKYNTTPPVPCQHFLTSFFQFLCAAENPPVFLLL